MKDAKTLLLEFLAAVTHGQDAGALFAEDGALELPFLHSVGIPWRHRGRQAIRELQNSLAGLYLDLAFKPEDTHVLIDTPDQVFAEYMAHTTAKATGRTLHHMFAARLVVENGLIKLVRESLNVVAAAQALLPGGVKDLPDPEKEIFSVPPGLSELRPSRVPFQHRQSSSLSRKHDHGRQRADRAERRRNPFQQAGLRRGGAFLVCELYSAQ